MGLGGFVAVGVFAQSAPPQLASLSLRPSSDTILADSVFTVEVMVNTHGNAVNAIDAALRFPPDKLQVVSPSAGQSVLKVWVTQPIYDNQAGEIRFQGAIPNPGIITNAGVVSQITFRAIGVGRAVVRFGEESKILLNDGKGTDILGESSGALFSLVLPPPAGPIVVSPTHPDPDRWYVSRSVSLEWATPYDADGYSYIVSDNPTEIPDDIPDGTHTSQAYQNLADGTHYFHIKAHRGGVWGGVTHYAVNIDGTPPAEFPIDIAPFSRTISQRPAISFETTDEASGVDRYEIRIIPVTPPMSGEPSTKTHLFIQADSPYVTNLELGKYDVAVRAYDHAGNYREEAERLEIVQSVFEWSSSSGIRIRSIFTIPWLAIWILLGIIILLLGFYARRAWLRHEAVHRVITKKELPADVRRQLEELKALREKYRHLAKVLLLACALTSLLGSGGPPAHAASAPYPPVIDVVSREIANDEIFYIGGKSDSLNGQVVVYLQSLRDGATQSFSVPISETGDWFYSHTTFLPSGEYLLWAQTKMGDLLSPPSPQVSLGVATAALEFGASRLSIEAIFMVLVVLLLLIIGVLGWLLWHHDRQGRMKHAQVAAEIKAAEESIRRGFALLKRDLEAEFLLIQKQGDAGSREKEMEERIRQDIERLRAYIGKEVWEIEKQS